MSKPALRLISNDRYTAAEHAMIDHIDAAMDTRREPFARLQAMQKLLDLDKAPVVETFANSYARKSTEMLYGDIATAYLEKAAKGKTPWEIIVEARAAEAILKTLDNRDKRFTSMTEQVAKSNVFTSYYGCMDPKLGAENADRVLDQFAARAGDPRLQARAIAPVITALHTIKARKPS